MGFEGECPVSAGRQGALSEVPRPRFQRIDMQVGHVEVPRLHAPGRPVARIRAFFPDFSAPIVRNTADGRELAMVRWGLPSPRFALQGKKVDRGVTNVRNPGSAHWRRWMGVPNRCVVPWTSFAEPEQQPDGSKPPAWFAFDESRPLAFFAGIWVPKWTSVRKLKEGEVTIDVFGFLTTEPNAEVKVVHKEAMPVILTTEDEIETWMTAPAEEALRLQRALPDGSLQIVARGRKEDGVDDA